MSQPLKAPEPSMDEILASIRRIISDDDATKPQPNRPEGVRPVVVAAETPAVPQAAQQSAATIVAAPNPELPAMNMPQIDAVIGEDNAGGGSAPASAPESSLGSDILELTEAMAANDPQATFRTIEAESDVVFSEVAEEPAALRTGTTAAPAALDMRSTVETALLSSATNAAVDAAFSALARTVLVQNARTIEDLVRDMLRPMLKSWLDDNLPNLVERLVRAEIERVSRGR